MENAELNMYCTSTHVVCNSCQIVLNSIVFVYVMALPSSCRGAECLTHDCFILYLLWKNQGLTCPILN